MAGFADLPDPLVAVVLSHLELSQRVGASAVCRQWRRAAAAPSAAWLEFQFVAKSLEQWMGMLRWLRPRAPALRRLRLCLYAELVTCRRQRLRSRCGAALRSLAARLAAARHLEDFSLEWRVAGPGRGDETSSEKPLPAGALLPDARRRSGRQPPLSHLTRLQLDCTAGVQLSPGMAQLPALRRLAVGRGVWMLESNDDSRLTAGAGAGGPAALLPCLPPALTSLVLASCGAIVGLAACPGLAAALPALRELRLRVNSPHDTPVLAAVRLLERLYPLAGQLQSLELPPEVLPAQVSRFTALRCLVAQRPPPVGSPAVWQGLLFSLSQLTRLDLRFTRYSDERAALPLPLADAPSTLRALCLLDCSYYNDVDFVLPPGAYLLGLEEITLSLLPALRLTPLLPFMPRLRRLVIEPRVVDSSPAIRMRGPPGGSGDARLDAAVAAAAGMSAEEGFTPASMLAAAKALAAALAAHRAFCALEVRPWQDDLPTAAAHLAVCLLKAAGVRVAVQVAARARDPDSYEDYSVYD